MNDGFRPCEAYAAMCVFLKAYDARGNGADTLVHVLSSISCYVWGDGMPNDPAMLSDWGRALGARSSELSADVRVMRRDPSGRLCEGVLTAGQAYIAMVRFLDEMYESGGGDRPLGEVIAMLESRLLANSGLAEPAEGNDWLDAIQYVESDGVVHP